MGLRYAFLSYFIFALVAPAPASLSAEMRSQVQASIERFQRNIEKAMQLLKESETPIGRKTYRYLNSGDVRIRSYWELTKNDFKHIYRDLNELDHRAPVPEREFERYDEDPRAFARAADSEFSGYTWGEHVYVTSKQTGKALASTLVHEANHAMNLSERHYYDSEENTFREEYRAFYAEALFNELEVDDPAFCRRLKLKVIRRYGLDSLDPDDFPNHP